MSTLSVATLVVGVLSVIAAPLVAYIVATRRLSGKISTSEASELWKESTAIRHDYRDRLRFADDHLRELEGRVRALEKENTTLQQENERLRAKVERLEAK